MTPATIQNLLKKKCITQETLAKELVVSTMMISGVINKKRVSDRCMKHIANRIGRTHTDVFPEYYLAPPSRRTSKVNYSHKNKK